LPQGKSVEYGSARDMGWLVLLESAGGGAVEKAIAATSAFMLKHFVHMMNVLHFRMDGAVRANFAAQAASNAEFFDDSDFHADIYFEPPRARPGSGAQGRRRKSKTSSMGF